MPTATELLFMGMLDEAEAAEALADAFWDDLELRTQYETEARTWRRALRMVSRANDDR